MANSDKPKSYKDLIVWQKGMDLAEEIQKLTRAFPREERFGLTSQVRRAALSIPANIAEGQARNTTPDFVRFISNAEGSVAELETELILAVRFGYTTTEAAKRAFHLLDETSRLLNALRVALLKRIGRGESPASTRHSSLVTRHSAPKDGDES